MKITAESTSRCWTRTRARCCWVGGGGGLGTSVCAPGRAIGGAAARAAAFARARGAPRMRRAAAARTRRARSWSAPTAAAASASPLPACGCRARLCGWQQRAGAPSARMARAADVVPRPRSTEGDPVIQPALFSRFSYNITPWSYRVSRSVFQALLVSKAKQARGGSGARPAAPAPRPARAAAAAWAKRSLRPRPISPAARRRAAPQRARPAAHVPT